MSKKIIIGVIFITLLFNVGCKFSEETSTDVVIDEKKIKIGFLMDTLKEERWLKDREIFVAEAAKNNAETFVLAANGNDERQLNQAKKLIEKGIDIFVVVPHDAVYSEKIVKLAHKNNIKVIAYDRLIEGNVDYYLSFDNERVGEIQGEYLTDYLNINGGNIVYIGGAQTDNNAGMFRKGFLDHVNEYEDISIIYDEYAEDWELTEAAKHIEIALAKNNNIDAIICANDGLAGAVSDVLAQKKINIPLFGQDAEISACQRIVEGKQSMTVYKDVRLLAKKAAEISVKIAQNKEIINNKYIENKKYKVPSILLEPVLVNSENMYEIIVNSGYHKFNDVYRNVPVEDRPKKNK